MRDVLRAGDQEQYFWVLARTDLLLPVSPDAAGRRSPGWGTWSSDGRTHVLAFTSPQAMRACLAEHAGSYRVLSFRDLASQWPNPDWWLAVNPGLPVEAYLPAWFVSQIGRGEVNLPGRGMGSRARMEHASTLRARAVAHVPRRPAGPGQPPAPGHANAVGQPNVPTPLGGRGQSTGHASTPGGQANGPARPAGGVFGSSSVPPASVPPAPGVARAAFGSAAIDRHPVESPPVDRSPVESPPVDRSAMEHRPETQSRTGPPRNISGSAPLPSRAAMQRGVAPGGPSPAGPAPGGVSPVTPMPLRSSGQPGQPGQMAPPPVRSVHSATARVVPTTHNVTPPPRPERAPQPAPSMGVEEEPTLGLGARLAQLQAITGDFAVQPTESPVGPEPDQDHQPEEPGRARGLWEPRVPANSFASEDPEDSALDAESVEPVPDGDASVREPLGSAGSVADGPVAGVSPVESVTERPIGPTVESARLEERNREPSPESQPDRMTQSWSETVIDRQPDQPQMSANRQPEPPAEPEPVAEAPAQPEPKVDIGDFQAANSTEEDLLAASTSANTDRFLSTLLLAKVLVPQAPADQGEWPTELINDVEYFVTFTSKERLAERHGPDAQAASVRFINLIARWPGDELGFAVNPGTIIGATLSGVEVRTLASWATEVGLIAEPEHDPEHERVAAADPTPAAARRPPPVAAPGQRLMMQKTIAAGQLPIYLDKGYDRVSGFVHRASEVAHLHTPEQLYRALGLAYEGSPHRPGDAEAYVLRWEAYCPSLYRIPFGGQNEASMHAMQGWVIERAPFRGNGFAPSETSDVIAEFKVDSTRLPHGAQLWRVSRIGTETLVATLDADGPRWQRVGEPD